MPKDETGTMSSIKDANAEQRSLRRGMLDGVSQHAGLGLLAIFVLAQISLAMLQALVWLQHDPYRRIYGQIESRSAFLIQPTLVYNTLVLLLIGVGLFGAMGRIGPRDLGLKKQHIGVGLAVLVGLWLATQLALTPNAWVMDGGLAWTQPTRGNGVPFVVGALIAQVFGNALVEELCFRGFLMVQLVLWFQARSPDQPKRALWRGVLVSQLIFSLVHLPIRIHDGGSGTQLLGASLETLAFGLFFAWQYLRTENFFAVIATHALINTPTPLFQSAYDPKAVVIALALVLTILWPWIPPSKTPTSDNDHPSLKARKAS